MTVSELTRQQLDSVSSETLRTGHQARPEVSTVRTEGGDLLVKDYHRGKSLFGRLLGRFLTYREKIAYERLKDLPGIPRYYGMLDPYALILQYVPSKHVREVEPNQIPTDFFRLLSELVENLHSRGIAHGDLHKLDNILIDNRGRPVIVDFASAIMTGSNPLAALLLPIFCAEDWRGIYKLKQQVAPGLLTEQQRKFIDHHNLGERIFRRIRKPIRSLIKRWSSK